MLKLFAKKGKDSKGFTLIELIVVIAIIGILALLLVPRFAGFTEDARVSNDRNACKTVERAFMTLIANGTYKVPAGGVTISIDQNGDFTYSSGKLHNQSDHEVGIEIVQAAIEKLTDDIKIQATTRHQGYLVTINTDGTVECTVVERTVVEAADEE